MIIKSCFICLLLNFMATSTCGSEKCRVLFKIDNLTDKKIVAEKLLETRINDVSKTDSVAKTIDAFGNSNTCVEVLYPASNTDSSWYLIKGSDSATCASVALRLEQNQIKNYIEYPVIFKSFASGLYSVNSTLWHLGSKGVDAISAWDINQGREDVIVAVCDGGVDYTHSDLDPGDRSHVITGYDFGDNDNDPMDDLPDAPDSYLSHGTHIAGIIGAIPNDSKGLSGVMRKCKIMPVKMVGSGSVKYPFTNKTVWDFSTTAFPSDVARSINYAVSNGASIINLSFGFDCDGADGKVVQTRLPALHSALRNAYYNNVLITCSMGNDYEKGNPIQYPAAFTEYVIAIGNLQENGTRWKSSSTGKHIFISAPGTSIYSTVLNPEWGFKTGTSMAAPVVAGVAGLIISQGRDRGYNLSNDDIKNILRLSAQDIGTVGFDNETSYGKVNAYNALKLLDKPNSIQQGNIVGGTATKVFSEKWIYNGDNWGIANGSYYVDVYEVKARVTFGIPFVTAPLVWMRDKESATMNFGSPNNGRQYGEITNIDRTGFNVRYAVYYIKTDAAGKEINKWYPANYSNSNFAYTALGVFDPNCDKVEAYQNFNTTSPEIINGCNVTLDNSMVSSNGSLTVNAVNSITITKEFNTVIGGTLNLEIAK